MGRKSKLSEAEWQEVERRLLDGETIRGLAREFDISEASIRAMKSARVAQIKTVANQIVETECALSAMPIDAQITAQNLASRLRAISSNLASAAHYGAATAHRLNALAHGEVAKIDDAAPLSSADSLKGVAVLTKLANDASSIGLNLLAANKEQIKQLAEREASEQAMREVVASTANMSPEEAYKRLLGNVGA